MGSLLLSCWRKVTNKVEIEDWPSLAAAMVGSIRADGYMRDEVVACFLTHHAQLGLCLYEVRVGVGV